MQQASFVPVTGLDEVHLWPPSFLSDERRGRTAGPDRRADKDSEYAAEIRNSKAKQRSCGCMCTACETVRRRLASLPGRGRDRGRNQESKSRS